MHLKLLLTVLVVSICAGAAAQGQYDSVAQQIEKEIQKNDKIDIQNLKVTHDAGTIYLEGVTERYGSRSLAEKIARKEGVKEVKNEIAVTAGDVPDPEIEANLTQKIQRHLRGSPFDLIAVRVNRGFVTMEGNVRDTTLREKAFDEAIWLRGVRGVENRIELASIGSSDERLRRIIYDRIRREFPQYFLGKFPSVLIIVNNARVTLYGSVDSQAAKQKIVSMVRSTSGVLNVEDRLEP